MWSWLKETDAFSHGERGDYTLFDLYQITIRRKNRPSLEVAAVWISNTACITYE